MRTPSLDVGTWAVQDNSERVAAAVKSCRLKQQCAWVEEVDEQLQPYCPLQLRARICRGHILCVSR